MEQEYKMIETSNVNSRKPKIIIIKKNKFLYLLFIANSSRYKSHFKADIFLFYLMSVIIIIVSTFSQ